MFYSLTTTIILHLTIFFYFLFLTIIYFLYSGFIFVAISKVSFAIAIETFIKPFRVLICLGISCIIYFAYFLLGFFWYTSNVCTCFEPHSSNYYKIVLFADTRAIPVLIYATFQIVICNGSIAFAFFYKRKRCLFLYSKVCLNYIISLLSALFLLRDNCNVGLLNVFELDFIWSGSSILGYIGLLLIEKV